jgi:hypothetical protein
MRHVCKPTYFILPVMAENKTSRQLRHCKTYVSLATLYLGRSLPAKGNLDLTDVKLAGGFKRGELGYNALCTRVCMAT